MSESTSIDSPNTLIVVTFILALLSFALTAYNINETRTVAAATLGTMTVVNRVEANEQAHRDLADQLKALEAKMDAAAAAAPAAEEAPAEEAEAAE